jgi:hypothetical protein
VVDVTTVIKVAVTEKEERWNRSAREREKERERETGREVGFLAEFEPNLLPVFTEKKFQLLILLVRISTVDSK